MRNYQGEYDRIIWRYKDAHPLLPNLKLSQLIISEQNIPMKPESFRAFIPLALQNRKNEPDRMQGDFPDLECFAKEITPFELEPKYNNLLVLSDIHIPFHSNMALKTALRYGRDKEVNTVILNGDIIDAYAVSRFERDPVFRNMTKELEIGRDFLRHLRDYFGKNVRIIYKVGNHDARLTKYLWDNVPEMAGNPDLDLENLLRLKDFNIEFADSKQIIRAGRLNIIHGHELLGGGGGINHARGILLKVFSHVLFGHFHRTQSYTQRTIDGSVIGSYAAGCLCNLTPEYMPINNWSLGFATVQTGAEGHYRVHNKTIVGGEVF